MEQTGKRSGKRWAIGTAVCLAVYLAGLFVCALLTVKGTVGEERMRMCCKAAMLLASLAGGLTAGGGGRLGAVVAPAALWLAVMLSGFVSKSGLDGEALLSLTPMLLLGTAGAYLLSGGGRRKKKSGRKRRYQHRK